MNTKRHRNGGGWLIAAAAGLVLLAGGAAFGDAGAASGSVAYTIRSPKQTYVCCEPLVLELTLTNVTQDPVQVNAPWDIGDGRTTVYQQRPGSEEQARYVPAIFSDYLSPNIVELAPGGAYTVRDLLTAYGGTSAFVLDRPGVHRFRVEAQLAPADGQDAPSGKRPSVLTNWLEVTVRAPEGRESEALALWTEGLKTNGFDLNSFATRGGALSRLLTEFPDTVYAFHGRHKRCTVGGLTESSLGELEDLYLNAPDFALRDEVMLDLARAYRSAQRYSDGAAVLGELLAEYPDSPLAEEAAERKPWYERYAEDAERAAAREAAEGE